MNFSNGEALLNLCQQDILPISEEMIRREVELTGKGRDAVKKQMAYSYTVMKTAAQRAVKGEIRSMGGLIGGESHLLWKYNSKGRTVSGNLTGRAAAYAIGMLEVNASMGLIVAAPTAGSSGVIPGAFLAVQEEYGFSEEQMTAALFNAGAVGYLITRNATVAGAEGGCQAEVGAASAMAASALTELMGGSPEQCLSAAACALANLLGLVCDPVGGLVETPCQTRNAIGASNALLCADMALCGINHLIPFDEMVDVMYRVGRSIPSELRETALSGCAASPTACRLCHR